ETGSASPDSIDGIEPEIALIMDGQLLIFVNGPDCPEDHDLVFEIRFEGKIRRFGEIVQAAVPQNQGKMGFTPLEIVIRNRRFINPVDVFIRYDDHRRRFDDCALAYRIRREDAPTLL